MSGNKTGKSVMLVLLVVLSLSVAIQGSSACSKAGTMREVSPIAPTIIQYQVGNYQSLDINIGSDDNIKVYLLERYQDTINMKDGKKFSYYPYGSCDIATTCCEKSVNSLILATEKELYVAIICTNYINFCVVFDSTELHYLPSAEGLPTIGKVIIGGVVLFVLTVVTVLIRCFVSIGKDLCSCGSTNEQVIQMNPYYPVATDPPHLTTTQFIAVDDPHLSTMNSQYVFNNPHLMTMKSQHPDNMSTTPLQHGNFNVVVGC